MIKRILLWLISIYFKPAEPTESQPKENIVKLTLVPIINDVIADGYAANKVLATVTDDVGTPLPGQSITFTSINCSVNNGLSQTDENGQFTLSAFSTKSGQATVNAVSNSVQASIQINFVANPDMLKAKLSEDDAADEGVAYPHINDVRAIFVKLEHPVIEVWDEVVALAKKYL